MSQIPALVAPVEGDRLAAFAERSDENVRAIASLHPFIQGGSPLIGQMVRSSSDARVSIVGFLGVEWRLWRPGLPLAEARSWATASIAEGVKVSTPWRPLAIHLHVRCPNQNWSDGGEESRMLIFEQDADGTDGPVPVVVFGSGVAVGERVQEISVEFESDGFTVTVEGDHPGEVDLVSALVFGEIEGSPDPSFTQNPAFRTPITASMTPAEMATARNASLASVRSRNRGPTPPPSPLEAELWEDTASGFVRQWVIDDDSGAGSWVNVWPLGGDVDGLWTEGPYAPGSVPDFGQYRVFDVKARAAVLVELRYPRGGVDGGITLYDRSTALLTASGEYFAVPVAQDPTAGVSLAAGVEKKTVRVALDIIGAGWAITRSSVESDSDDAVAAVEIVNVLDVGTY